MDNVISFPKENKRLDVTNTPLGVEEVAKAIEGMKMDFYHDVADTLMDHIIQSIGTLNLDGGNTEEVKLREIDIILMREVLTAFMCKIADVDHPLKALAEIVVTDLVVNDGMIDYRLKLPKQPESV